MHTSFLCAERQDFIRDSLVLAPPAAESVIRRGEITLEYLFKSGLSPLLRHSFSLAAMPPAVASVHRLVPAHSRVCSFASPQRFLAASGYRVESGFPLYTCSPYSGSSHSQGSRMPCVASIREKRKGTGSHRVIGATQTHH